MEFLVESWEAPRQCQFCIEYWQNIWAYLKRDTGKVLFGDIFLPKWKIKRSAYIRSDIRPTLFTIALVSGRALISSTAPEKNNTSSNKAWRARVKKEH